MKEQINKLIDELASKELTFGCVCFFHPDADGSLQEAKMAWHEGGNFTTSHNLIDSSSHTIYKIIVT